MRRVLWVGVGVAISVVVVRRGRRVVERYAPAALVDRAGARVDELGGRALRLAREVRAEFSAARAERERELMAALLAEGQEDPAAVRSRRAADRRSRGAAPDVPDPRTDDVEDLLGYSF